MYVSKGGGGRKTEGVWGRVVGERWCWSQRSTGVVVAVRFAGGGVFFLAGGAVALVLIETSNMTKTGLTGWVNGAAVTERLYSASHTPLCPLSSRPALPYFTFMPPTLVVLTYFSCSSSMLRVNLMCQSLTCVKALIEIFPFGQKKVYSHTLKKKKRCARMSWRRLA